MEKRRIIVADTETTGLSATAAIVEYAQAEVEVYQDPNTGTEQLRVVREFESLINPCCPIDPGASKVHGIFAEHVKDSPLIEDVLCDAYPEGHCDLIGHNFYKYDMQYLHKYVPASYDIGCTLAAARRFLPEQPKHSLDKLRMALNFPVVKAHSALGDVHSTIYLANLLLQQGMGYEGLRAVLLQKHTVWGFGKHKGQFVMDLPVDYAEWALANLDMKWFERAALNRRLGR